MLNLKELCIIKFKDLENKIFKTNINCASCVQKVTETLDGLVGEDNWSVDTTIPIKLLTIENENISADAIIAALNGIGYKADVL